MAHRPSPGVARVLHSPSHDAHRPRERRTVPAISPLVRLDSVSHEADHRVV